MGGDWAGDLKEWTGWGGAKGKRPALVAFKVNAGSMLVYEKELVEWKIKTCTRITTAVRETYP